MITKPRYIPFKQWIADRAIELGLKWHGAYDRWRRGALKAPYIRRINKRVWLVRI